MKKGKRLAILLAAVLALVGVFSVSVFAVDIHPSEYLNYSWGPISLLPGSEIEYSSTGSYRDSEGTHTALITMTIENAKEYIYSGTAKTISVNNPTFKSDNGSLAFDHYKITYSPTEDTSASLEEGYPVHVGSYDANIEVWNASLQSHASFKLDDAIVINPRNPVYTVDVNPLIDDTAYVGEPINLLTGNPIEVKYPEYAVVQYRYSKDNGENWSSWLTASDLTVSDTGEYIVQYRIKKGLTDDWIPVKKTDLEGSVNITHGHVWNLRQGKSEPNKAILKCTNKVGDCEYQNDTTVAYIPTVANINAGVVFEGVKAVINEKKIPEGYSIATQETKYCMKTFGDDGEETLSDPSSIIPTDPGKYVAKITVIFKNKSGDVREVAKLESNEFIIHGHEWNLRQGKEETNKAFVECKNTEGSDVCDYQKSLTVAEIQNDIPDKVFDNKGIKAKDIKHTKTIPEGLNIEVGHLYFIKDGNNSKHLDNATDPGTYVAKVDVTLGEVEDAQTVTIVSNEFTIHGHEWSLRQGKSEPNKALLKCTGTIGTEVCQYQKEKSVVVMPYDLEDRDYNGKPYTLEKPSVNKNAPEDVVITVGDVEYYPVLEDGLGGKLDSAPISSGTYVAKVSVSIEGQEAIEIESNKFKINHVHEWNLRLGSSKMKAFFECESEDTTECGFEKPNLIAEMPTVSDKTYDGESVVVEPVIDDTRIPEELKDSVSFSNIYYIKDEAENSVDNATDVGKYVAYLDITFGDKTITIKSNEFNINKQNVLVKWDEKSEFIYNGRLLAPKAFFYKSDDTETTKLFDAEITGAEKNANVNGTTYGAKANIPEELAGNYEFTGDESSLTKKFTIIPKPVRLNWDEQGEFVYNGGVQYPEARVNRRDVARGDERPTVEKYTFKYELTDEEEQNPVNVDYYYVIATELSDSNYRVGQNDEREGYYFAYKGYSIIPAVPAIVTAPTASAITLGQTLGDSVLSDGTAVFDSSDGEQSVDGTFTWTDPTIKPEKTGAAEYSVTFTPADTVKDNFESTTVDVSVTVNAPAPGPSPAPATDDVQKVVDMLKALDPNASDYAAKAQEAIDAYNKLTDAQKADDRFKEQTVATKLADAQEAVKSEEQKAADKKAADEVSALINKLPEKPADANYDDALAAYNAYMALTDAQKALLDEKTQAKIAEYGYYYGSQYAASQTVKLKSVKAKKGRKAVAKWSKNADVSGYQLYYKAKGTKAKKVTISKASTVKKTVKKLKAGKKYSFKVRTYTKVYNPATGATEKVYGQWSNVKKAKAKK